MFSGKRQFSNDSIETFFVIRFVILGWRLESSKKKALFVKEYFPHSKQSKWGKRRGGEDSSFGYISYFLQILILQSC